MFQISDHSIEKQEVCCLNFKHQWQSTGPYSDPVTLSVQSGQCDFLSRSIKKERSSQVATSKACIHWNLPHPPTPCLSPTTTTPSHPVPAVNTARGERRYSDLGHILSPTNITLRVVKITTQTLRKASCHFRVSTPHVPAKHAHLSMAWQTRNW